MLDDVVAITSLYNWSGSCCGRSIMLRLYARQQKSRNWPNYSPTTSKLYTASEGGETAAGILVYETKAMAHCRHDAWAWGGCNGGLPIDGSIPTQAILRLWHFYGAAGAAPKRGTYQQHVAFVLAAALLLQVKIIYFQCCNNGSTCPGFINLAGWVCFCLSSHESYFFHKIDCK